MLYLISIFSSLLHKLPHVYLQTIVYYKICIWGDYKGHIQSFEEIAVQNSCLFRNNHPSAKCYHLVQWIPKAEHILVLIISIQLFLYEITVISGETIFKKGNYSSRNTENRALPAWMQISGRREVWIKLCHAEWLHRNASVAEPGKHILPLVS